MRFRITDGGSGCPEASPTGGHPSLEVIVKIYHSVEIDAPVDRLWNILADEFADIGLWATAVPSSKAEGTPPTWLPDAPAATRSCDLNLPGIRAISETITRFDPANHVLSYRVDEGMPSFVTGVSNTWSLTSVGPGRTRVTMLAEATLGGAVGTLATPMMRLNFARTLRGLGRDLAIYAVTGLPSDSKRRASRRLADRSAVPR
jgi:hypothetical protein